MTLFPDFVICFVKAMPRDYTSAPQSICVLRLSAIGDCCHTLPVVRTLQRKFPDCRITWVIGTTEHNLLKGVYGVEFITFDKSNSLQSWRKLRRELADRRFDILLHMNASWRANLVRTAIRASTTIGFDRQRARDFQWLFSDERIAPRHPDRRHVLDGLFQFAEHLGITDRDMRWDIPVYAKERELAANVVAAARPVIAISPCSSQRARNFRNWDAARFVELINSLQTQYSASVVLTGAPTETELAYERAILDGTQGVKSLIGKTSLKEVLALLESADLVICPDSGPAHMATAAGTPVIGLYATSNPERTGPYNSLPYTVNRYPDAVMQEFGKPVEQIRFGKRVREPEAMQLITVEDVLQKTAKALADCKQY